MSELDPEQVEPDESDPMQHARDTGERIRELADRDEAAAEAPEPEATEPEQPAPPSDAEVESWPLCPVCGGIGRIPPEFQPHVRFQRCPDCNGMGEGATGSLKPDAAVLPCTTCNGNGYVEKPPPPLETTPPAGEPPRSW